MELSFLSFNIWGLPFGFASNTAVRISAIASALFSTNYDIICLQEVWTKHDYNIFKEHLKETHRFHHYFYSGLIGSGLCIFSKYPIEDTFYYKFPMNGLFHMIHHGDWFGGKGVGLASINFNGLKINVYNTHLHANYSIDDNDPYYIHRLIQALDTALFIKHTSGYADLSILGGDLNSTPNDLGVKLLEDLACLKDTFKLAEHCELVPETNNSKRNSYREKGLKEDYKGVRIDYIFLRNQGFFEIKVAEHIFPFNERIPYTQISYSDHEAIAVKFYINKRASGSNDVKIKTSEEKENSLDENLEKALKCCGREIVVQKKRAKKLFIYMFCFFSALFVFPFITYKGFVMNVLFSGLTALICFNIAVITACWHDVAWLKNTRKRLKLFVKS